MSNLINLSDSGRAILSDLARKNPRSIVRSRTIKVIRCELDENGEEIDGSKREWIDVTARCIPPLPATIKGKRKTILFCTAVATTLIDEKLAKWNGREILITPLGRKVASFMVRA